MAVGFGQFCAFGRAETATKSEVLKASRPAKPAAAAAAPATAATAQQPSVRAEKGRTQLQQTRSGQQPGPGEHAEQQRAAPKTANPKPRIEQAALPKKGVFAAKNFGRRIAGQSFTEQFRAEKRQMGLAWRALI